MRWDVLLYHKLELWAFV